MHDPRGTWLIINQPIPEMSDFHFNNTDIIDGVDVIRLPSLLFHVGNFKIFYQIANA